MKASATNHGCPKCGTAIPADAPRGLCPRCLLSGASTAQGTSPLPCAAAPASSDVPSLERVQAAFPQLEVIELIGRGGMGSVFKARQPHLDRLVALKLLSDKLARDARFAERFNREGRVLAKLNHPNIVSVFDFGRTADFYFLTMEYVDGVNLRQAMQAGRFAPPEALAVVPKICEALQYAHEQGVLHRDIKPENILLDAKGRVKIADFGIAKLVEDDPRSVTLTATGAALGTPHYMAPEQLEKPGEVDHRADIYSLGVVFYEMLTGELPIGRFEPPSAKTPVATSVDAVVFRALEKDREKRFQSAGEVKTQIQTLAAQGAAEVPAQACSGASLAGPRHRRPAWFGLRRGVLKWAVLTLALLGAGTFAVRNLVDQATPRRTRGARPAAPAFETAAIQFTFTAAMVVREDDASWLALDYAEQVRGDCQRYFRYDASVPGFTATTRARSFMTDGRRGFAPVMHQRIAWKLPPTLSEEGARALTERAIGEWVGKAIVVEPGQERVLFRCAIPEGGRLTGFLGVNAGRFTAAPPNRAQEDAGAPPGAPPNAVRHGNPAPHPPADRGGPQRNAMQAPRGAEPLRVSFKVPGGQTAVLELHKRIAPEQRIPLPSMAGFVIAPGNDSVAGQILLEPIAAGATTELTGLSWTMSLLAPDGTKIQLGTEQLGPLRLATGVKPPLQLPGPTQDKAAFEMTLTPANPEDASPTAPALQSALGLSIRFVPKPVMYPDPGSPILGGGTNWETGFGLEAMFAPRAGSGSNNPTGRPEIRLSVTDVSLRADPDARWLMLELMGNVDTNWLTTFRGEATGFTTAIRTVRLIDSRAGRQELRRERLEVRLPSEAKESIVTQLREELAAALATKAVEVPTAGELTLFSVPIDGVGKLSVAVSARPAHTNNPP
jgi:tRNA A-37 threonylcarbamoyl transferase component Bud32